LLNHNCLKYHYRSCNPLTPWSFEGSNGIYSVDTRDSVIANSVHIALDVGNKRLGVGYAFKEYRSEALETGRLEEVLSDFQASFSGIHIYFPREYRGCAPTRLFIDHIRKKYSKRLSLADADYSI